MFQRFSIVSLVLFIAINALIVTACNSPFTPKPTGYYAIKFPIKTYQIFNQPGYPYSFEFPAYANVVKDSTFFGTTTENPWWININFPEFGGRIYMSYKKVGVGRNNIDTLIKDAYTLTGKHSSKAYSIEDSLVNTVNGIHGVFFSVGGDVATANQFFLTDTSKNFIRGALYFDATPNADSLKIVNQFLLEDMKHLIKTFKWKN
jgi:gliding motility-associated lipoprotein GldD